MRAQSQRLSEFLSQCCIVFLECDLCSSPRGCEEHIPGPGHFKCMEARVGSGPIDREKFWQEWSGISGCKLRFNHIDGTIEMRRGGSDSMRPTPGMEHVPASALSSPSLSMGAAAPSVAPSLFPVGPCWLVSDAPVLARWRDGVEYPGLLRKLRAEVQVFWTVDGSLSVLDPADLMPRACVSPFVCAPPSPLRVPEPFVPALPNWLVPGAVVEARWGEAWYGCIVCKLICSVGVLWDGEFTHSYLNLEDVRPRPMVLPPRASAPPLPLSSVSPSESLLSSRMTPELEMRLRVDERMTPPCGYLFPGTEYLWICHMCCKKFCCLEEVSLHLCSAAHLRKRRHPYILTEWVSYNIATGYSFYDLVADSSVTGPLPRQHLQQVEEEHTMPSSTSLQMKRIGTGVATASSCADPFLPVVTGEAVQMFSLCRQDHLCEADVEPASPPATASVIVQHPDLPPPPLLIPALPRPARA